MPNESRAEVNQVVSASDNILSDRSRLIELTRQRVVGGGDRAYRRSVPLIITTDEFAAQGRYTLFWAGAKSVTWTFRLRGSEQLTPSGSVAYFWRDAVRNTYFDEPILTFTFQTGNLLPIRDVGGNIETLPPGLLDYYDFFDMLDSKKSYADGVPNYVRILYSSLLYPQIMLTGFFVPSSSITVVEDASSPDSVEWQADFRVYESSPRFQSGRALSNEWYSSFLGFSEDIESSNEDSFESEIASNGIPETFNTDETSPILSGPESGPAVGPNPTIEIGPITTVSIGEIEFTPGGD